jgi:hypothetical protein
MIKMDSVKAALTKKYKRSREVATNAHQTEWKNPDTKTKWVLRSLFSKENNKPWIYVNPITQFNEAGKKKYLLFAIERLQDVPRIDNSLVKIFDGHFISRYLERNNELEYSPYQVILDFPLNDNICLVEHFSQNVEWHLYMHRTGIAMIKNDPPFIYFDTYIHLSSIKEEQKRAVKEHLSKLHSANSVDYLKLYLILSSVPAWKEEYFPEEAFNNAKLRVKEINPEFLQTVLDLL